MLEKHIVVKLFHNKELQKAYLPDILYGLFIDKELKTIVYLMQRLFKNKSDITVDNLVFISHDQQSKAFFKKNLIGALTADQIANIVFDMTISSNADLFHQAYEQLCDVGFAKFVESTIKDINYDLSYNNRPAVLARTRSIEKAHNIIFARKLKQRGDDIGQAAIRMTETQYQQLFSLKLRTVLGGLSKGWVTTIIGRPSHCKSTLVSYDACWNIKHKILDRVDVISAEESSDRFWYRVFSHEFKIDMNSILHGLVKLTREQIQRVKDIYEGKLIFHPLRSLEDIADLTASLNTERITLDHVNAIAYPRDDQYAGIMALINMQKDYLARKKDTVIINLSQVNTKEMLKKGRLIPEAEDAYQSSILQQASREFLSIYYPIKDKESPEFKKLMVGKKMAAAPDNALQVYIRKNSYGDTGFINLKFHEKYSYFEDFDKTSDGELSPNIILPSSLKDDDFSELFKLDQGKRL